MALVVAFAVAGLACLLIARSARLHLRYTADLPGGQPQKVHSQPVPRIGGLGVMGGILIAGLAVPASAADARTWWLLMLCLLPAFLGGFAEDLTRRVGAGSRLVLTVITAAVAYSLADVHFVRSGMGWLDQALAFPPFGYAALLFAVAGVAQAVNIIDGYHGLAAGVATIILGAIALVAHAAGDALVASFCGVAAAATLGFLLVNYPFGRIFLGDGGAYLLGCVIALGSALLVLRDPQVSPWFPFALVIYPVWETLFSMVRRKLLHRARFWEPDAHHLHSLVYQQLSRRWIAPTGPRSETLRNAATSLPFWVACAVNALIAVRWSGDTRVMQGLAAVFPPLYCATYWYLTRPGARDTGTQAPSPPRSAG